MKRSSSILIICPYPFDTAGSQRFRHELYFDVLKAEGILVEVASFWSRRAYARLTQGGSVLHLVPYVIWGMLSRISLVWRARKFDLVYLHREATPFGPPWVEACLRMLGKQWVFDFDDAIWTTDRVKEPYLLRLLKTRSKIQYQLRHATLVLAGNTYLKSFAASFNAQVEVFPTVVDTNRFDMPEKDKVSNELVVGWTGTHSTLPYLMQWLPLLRSVYQSCPFVLHLICNVTPPIEFPSVRITLWHADSESKDLEAFDIGIMPLPDDPWTKGKCGFKAIQYMAKGIPTIASPVGVNTELIEHGISGLLADTREEWSEALLLLLHDEQSRRAMGLAARRTIEERYSKRAVETLFVQRIKACLAK